MANALDASALKLWPARKVPFVFDTNYPYVNAVLDMMKYIQDTTRIWFCQRGNEAKYVHIQSIGPGSYTDVGVKGGPQVCTCRLNSKRFTSWDIHSDSFMSRTVPTVTTTSRSTGKTLLMIG
jgi:hypothetical protein